ncbi:MULTISPECIES: glycosyltransferase [Pseudomonas]|jgi:rhamnosyltransferase|uniref:glycosyltransferase n=1 Tax=Pseudomonas TaxID=286 RepID=UPI001A9D69C1|nr:MULTISPECIES: glycosyltransferase [Pseudomonas]MDH1256814.1 glycosyltransferase [Pseudomonas atacamensis]MEB2856611.1 glycosyltransferase [Pseudomonas atacamensis]
MPVKHPRIAVLLAAYNGMQWIEEQVASILGQRGVDVTIHISVDLSDDGTEAWCKALEAVDSRVVLLPPAGRFGGAARNFFRLIRDVDLHDYDAVSFADQDDIWESDKLLRATQVMAARDVDAYSSNVTAFWPDGMTVLLDKSQPQVGWDFLFEAAGPGCTYVLCPALATSLRRQVIQDWEQLQQVSLHDWYCYAFARSHGFLWFIDSRPSMLYRQHESNQVGANTGLASLFQRYVTIHEGWWFKQVRTITLLVGADSDPFVKSWLKLRRRDLLRLSVSGGQCRRRRRDKVLFFFVCCLTAVVGRKS